MQDSELVRALVLTPCLSSLDAPSLNIGPRIEALWHHEQKNTEELLLELVKKGKNKLVEEVVTAVARQVTPTQALDLLRKSPSLGAAFVRHNRDLVHASSLWSGPINLQHELFDALTRHTLSGVEQKKIAAAVFNANAEALASDLAAQFEIQAAESILEQLEAEPRALSPSWQNVLKSCPDVFTSWLCVQIGTETASPVLLREVVASSLLLFSPHLSEWTTIKVEGWQHFLEMVRFEEWGSSEIAAFIFSLGLAHLSPEWSVLVEQSFEIVHEALAENVLSLSAWKWLEGQLPDINNDWDRCERLRRGLIQKFVVCSWPAESFIRTAKKAETLEQLFASCQVDEPSEEWRKQVRKEVKAGREKVPAWQKPIWEHKKNRLIAKLESGFQAGKGLIGW